MNALEKISKTITPVVVVVVVDKCSSIVKNDSVTNASISAAMISSYWLTTTRACSTTLPTNPESIFGKTQYKLYFRFLVWLMSSVKSLSKSGFDI